MNRQLEIESKFKNCFLTFIDELIEQLPEETDLVVVKFTIENVIPIKTVINKFTEKILPYKSMVKMRNERFFLENDDIFVNNNVDMDSIFRFKEIWKSDRLDRDDKITIWKWFDTFIALIEEYNKEKEKVD